MKSRLSCSSNFLNGDNPGFPGGWHALMRKQEIVNTVAALAAPCADQLGLTLWDVEFVREGADYFLRVFIDSENGVDVDDCEAMSQALDPLLDEADPIEFSYQLEVCSPGVERVLRTPEHKKAFIGRKVRAKLYKQHPELKSKEPVGTLAAYDDATGAVTLECEGKIYVLESSEVAKLNAYFDFAAAKNARNDI
jgi:ribosome maturation factor RimP